MGNNKFTWLHISNILPILKRRMYSLLHNNTLIWLHISDIHFGHGKEARHRVDQKIVCTEILRDAGEVVKKLGSPDLVLVTGDIAFKADRKEYEQATQWLEQLLNTVSADKNRLYLVPGNHDVNRIKVSSSHACETLHKALRAKPSDLDEYLDKPGEMALIWPKFEVYSKFATAYAAPELTPQNPYWICNLDIPLGKILIAGLNTNLLSFDDQDDPKNLALGSRQLEQAIQSQPRDALLLILQHHPPAWLTDRKQLLSMLRDRAHILFCGHVHEQGGLLSNPLHDGALLELVAGAGHTDPGPSPEHAYAWGRLSPAGLDYFPRTWNAAQHRFVADRNSFTGMNSNEAVPITRNHLPEALRKWLPKRRCPLIKLVLIALMVLIVTISICLLKPPPPPSGCSVENIHGWSAQQIKALQQQTAQALKIPVEFRDPLETLKDGSQGPVMVVIPGGCFLMGSPLNEPKREEYERQHEVEVAPFALGKYAVTFEEYDRFAVATNRQKPGDEGWGRGRRPVINVTWFDAAAYAEWLSQQTRQAYRLPTEAEWEYAARAGTTTPFYFGTTISTEQANYNGNDIYDQGRKGIYREQTVEVGQFPANAWGLYDMHGNVWEWSCSEYNKKYGDAALRCISDPNSSSRQVSRGGSWDNEPDWLRSAARGKFNRQWKGNNWGFRLARTLTL